MTEKERLDALLEREKPDRVPVWPLGYPGFATINAGYTVADAYNKPEKAFEAQKWCCEQYGWIFTPLFFYGGWASWEFGGEIRWPTGEFDQAPLITRHPVESEEDAMNLVLPDVKSSGIIPMVAEFNRLAIDKMENDELFYILVPVGGPFSLAANMCSAERLLKWVMKKPELANHVLRMATDHSLGLFEYWKSEFGTEKLLPFVGEPAASNQLISPKMFEKFAFPYLKELHEKTLGMGYKHIYCHICGEANANLPYWAQIPMGDPGIISVGHEVDVLTAAE